MSDNKYCYPNSDVLINKLNIRDSKELFKYQIGNRLVFLSKFNGIMY